MRHEVREARVFRQHLRCPTASEKGYSWSAPESLYVQESAISCCTWKGQSKAAVEAVTTSILKKRSGICVIVQRWRLSH